MKKEIMINHCDYLKIKYIISKNKYAIYTKDILLKTKILSFVKNGLYHRPCNIGPQYHGHMYKIYMENDRLHNMYGYSHYNKINNIKVHYINDIHYKEDQFNKYVNIYNKLNYKRTY